MLKFRRQAKAAMLLCAVAATAACDELLEVELPSAVTDEVLNDPGTAALQVSSVMAAVECGYGTLAVTASGFEDNWQLVAGSGSSYSQYDDTPDDGDCDEDVWSDSWMDALLVARGEGYRAYSDISGYDVPGKEKLLATLAMYNAVTLGVFGEFFCEFAISSIDRSTGTVTYGDMLTYNQTLAIAEGWADSVFLHLAAPEPLTTTAGTVTPDMLQTTYGLRARIRYANGDLAGAALDAALVTTGHMAWVLREEPEDRRNLVSTANGNGGGIQAEGFLQGPVRIDTNATEYGISLLGSHPVTGIPWPDPVPFTGYLDLAIQTADGRAIDDAGYPLTTATAGTTVDTRVPHAIGNTAGGPLNVEQKYGDLAADIPLLNWREMRLIQAEAAGPGAAGLGFVNEIRTADGLPLVTGGYATLVQGDATAFDNLLIEERRRALWLEARFWSTKILKNEKLWFPRREGEWVNVSSYELNGGVRVLMDESEYAINPNLGLEARGTGCPAGQRPVFN